MKVLYDTEMILTCLTSLTIYLSLDSFRTHALSSVYCTRLWLRQWTEARISRILWPYPVPIPMFSLVLLQFLSLWKQYLKYRARTLTLNRLEGGGGRLMLPFIFSCKGLLSICWRFSAVIEHKWCCISVTCSCKPHSIS